MKYAMCWIALNVCIVGVWNPALAQDGNLHVTIPPVGKARAERIVQGWGKVVDPKNDCRFITEDGTLTIAVPGTYHDLAPFPKYENLDAPRVLQEVEGDFNIRVCVKKFDRPEPKSGVNLPAPQSYVSGGLLVWQDSRNFVRFQRAASGDSGFVGTFSQYIVNNQTVAGSRIELPDKDIFLHIARRGNRLTFHQSTDGRIWQAVEVKGRQGLTVGGKVKVGVFAINATKRAIQHQYSDFLLERL